MRSCLEQNKSFTNQEKYRTKPLNYNYSNKAVARLFLHTEAIYFYFIVQLHNQDICSLETQQGSLRCVGQKMS